MYTRLSSGNLDFDPELQHVFCWESDECCVRVFPSFLLNAVCRVWLGSIKRCTKWQFLTRTHVFLVTACYSPGSSEDSRVLGILMSGRLRWTSAEHVALSKSVHLLSPFVSVSVFRTTQRRLALRKFLHPSSFMLHSFSNVCFLSRVFVNSQLRTCLADGVVVGSLVSCNS